MFTGNAPIRRPHTNKDKTADFEHPVMRQLSPPVSFRAPVVPPAHQGDDAASAKKHRRTISTQSYDKSYAYGAPSNGNESLLRQSVTAGRSALSPTLETADGRSDVSSTSVAFGSPVVDPHTAAASARYAKYNGQSTSVAGPSQPRPIAVPPKPTSSSAMNTSVNVATAFRQAHAGSIGLFGRAGDPEPMYEDEQEQRGLEEGDTSHDTVLEESDEMRLDREEGDEHHVTFENGMAPGEGGDEQGDAEMRDEQQQPGGANLSTSRGTKRKGRRSIDPSYRPRPGEEESDESELGEGISTKRTKRAKRADASTSSPIAPPAPEQQTDEANASRRKSAGAGKRKLARDSTWHPGKDGDESDSSSGEGIAQSRARRAAKAVFAAAGNESTANEQSINGVTYRLREPTESTSFSNEEQMVDLEVQRRQALQQQRMQVLQQRQQQPPQGSPAPRRLARPVAPPTPAEMATPYPPGRYQPTPRQRSEDGTELYGSDSGPSAGQLAGMHLRRGLLTVFSALRSLLWAMSLPFRMASQASWSSLAKYAAMIAIAASIFAAFTDNRAARGLWRIPIGFKDPVYQAPDVPADSLHALISRLSTVERSLATLSAADRSHAEREQADARDLSRRITSVETRSDRHVAEVQKAVDALKSTLSSLSSDVHADRKTVTALDDKVRKATNDVASLRDRVSAAEQTVRSEKLAKIVGEQVDKLLPARLAVSVDPKTGMLDISKPFWDALKDELVDRREVSRMVGDAVAKEGGRKTGQTGSSSRAAAPSWSDFLSTNEKELQRVLDAKIEAGAKSGAILSKGAFRDLLEREIRGQIKQEVRGGLEDRINDNVQDIGRELLAKFEGQQATLRSRIDALVANTKPATIKTSSGADLHAVVSQIVNAALLRHTKDVIARADFALYTAGARVVPALTSPTYEVRPVGVLRRMLAMPFGIGVIRGRPPVVALHPDTNVGACWSFPGPTGQLGVRLSRTIAVDAVVLEHAPIELEPYRESAPADFEVWGEVADAAAATRLATARANGDLETTSESFEALTSAIPPSPNHVLLVAGRYDASAEAATHIQTFDVPEAIRRLELPVGVIVLRILGLHGATGPGCLYRLRVLGAPIQK